MNCIKMAALVCTLLLTGLINATVEISIVIQPGQTPEQIANQIVQRAAEITNAIDLEIRFSFSDRIPAEQRTPLLNAVFQQLVHQDRMVIPKITALDLRNNSLEDQETQLDFSYFNNLQDLTLHGNDLTHLPNLTGLANLKQLYLDRNKLAHEQERLDFSDLRNLKVLTLAGNNLTRLPNLACLLGLKKLFLQRNRLGEQPEPLDFSTFINLGELDLDGNNLAFMPKITGLQHLEFLKLRGNPRLSGQWLRTCPYSEAYITGIDRDFIDYIVPEPTTVGDERLLTNLDEFRLTASLLLTAHTWLDDDDIAPMLRRLQTKFEQGNRVSVAELKRWIEEDELVQRHSQPAQVVVIENLAQNQELFDVATSGDDRPVFLSRSTLMGLQAGRRYLNPLNRQPILPVGKARNLAAAWLYWHAIREEDGSYKHPVGVQYFEALARQDDPVAHEPFTVAIIIALDYLKARGLNDAQSSVILRELPKYERNFVQAVDVLDAVSQ